MPGTEWNGRHQLVYLHKLKRGQPAVPVCARGFHLRKLKSLKKQSSFSPWLPNFKRENAAIVSLLIKFVMKLFDLSTTISYINRNHYMDRPEIS